MKANLRKCAKIDSHTCGIYTVWIGEGVSIMPGVTLGDNVIVGANAVVTHSFPANSVIAGCPARVIRAL